jgi:acetoin utilization deacetylase AcuC-like enzyme
MWWDTRAGAAFMPAGGWLEPGEHAENPSTKRRFKNLIDVSGMADHLVPIKPRMATIEEVERYHTKDYVARMKELSDSGGGDAGELTPFSGGGFEIALLAVGGTLTAIEMVVGGELETAYALVRPPGHHAQKDLGRGFCMFSNAALGALHARHALGLERVAVVDWDVHHGNGTQWAFYDDPSVLAISLHQDRYFPLDSGMVEETGEGAGVGTNINVPLPSGAESLPAGSDHRRLGPRCQRAGSARAAADALRRVSDADAVPDGHRECQQRTSRLHTRGRLLRGIRAVLRIGRA